MLRLHFVSSFIWISCHQALSSVFIAFWVFPSPTLYSSCSHFSLWPHFLWKSLHPLPVLLLFMLSAVWSACHYHHLIKTTLLKITDDFMNSVIFWNIKSIVMYIKHIYVHLTTRHCWLTPVILATWEAIGESSFHASLGKKLASPHLKQKEVGYDNVCLITQLLPARRETQTGGSWSRSFCV
jgi:hypothetical protein